ncbi:MULTISPECIES: flagellar basal body rod protein FlgC [Cellulomonas]|uniref:Flagellar basal-body rod protein FlgC n=1 Tax=Cellulomonas oligotrophica TaxID=931536 RepID=A0A7Y9K0F7_9CELL|nr:MULTISPECIES: flagellar basal body rod protein FlgC [Cellulomonas]NYD87245.1 flagellar basal-body rod protein FlgC [Cellulomonas oligotrophica]TQL01640.1 flagellar basal-body rod protein FlgC [Cellulomonas sp. SLBN-39]GIG34027.1 flagellar basal-body rod protein FlgC [Cellulomonas oligotrophica]
MTIFGAIGIASTGMTVHRKWLDAVSDNLSNANTVRSSDEAAFQARYVVAQEMTGGDGGVQVAGIALGSAEGRMVYEPDHPLADEEGYVRYPDIDMSSQMTQLIMAQRGYQANAAVVDRAKATYEAALQIGRS